MRIAVLSLFLTLKCAAFQVAWDTPTNSVSGYVLFHGVESGNYSDIYSCGLATNFEVDASQLPLGVNYFAVTAFIFTNGVLNMSGFSNEVIVTNSQGLVLNTVVFSSTNLIQWQPWHTSSLVIMPNCGSQFFISGSQTLGKTNIITSPKP